MNNLLLFDDNSKTLSKGNNFNASQTPSYQSSTIKSVEFHIPEVSIDVVNTAYERHTSGLMSTYLYHILTKVTVA